MTDQSVPPATPYEPPRIEAKASIAAPLVQTTSSPVACAVFRPL